MLHIVLHEPEMPANTGNIGRTCVACGAVLHLIEPLGFRLNEKMIKRAGLDYWEHLDVRTYLNFEDFLEKNRNPKIYMATTKARHMYSEPAYEKEEDVYVMFGKESAGIPEEILLDYEATCIRIPMLPKIRSLNLSNSVAIVAYEVLRHQGFKEFQTEGQLHKYHW
ncbi:MULTISPECIES: tRNA (cytidine(34)-2'-O)-methyltransferase [Anaerostipes]|uniref:Putative tRNA (cytidine(34)-2'-O)-methyltransferase n=1 Tax=Anaerostipes butyraticus TaxID=645466 RepID=A0A916VCS3_9FIRM|nr:MULTISPECIES: tRNA (cytidine(34)-2'-O)-methyltransferase [Anaerostipes]GFO84368.1 putative tRNA (cytidine(34)-2'-O)-methyltransferase [Anaerostipes butyraticus]